MSKQAKTAIQTIIEKILTDAKILCAHFDFLSYTSYLIRQIDTYIARRSELAESLYLHLSIYFDMMTDENSDLDFCYSAISNHCTLCAN